MLVQRVAILGGGPSAAFALQACRDRNVAPEVFANEHTQPRGAFYVHWVPETVSRRSRYKLPVYWLGMGSAGRYVEKMWGEKLLSSSFPEEPRVEQGYHPSILTELWGLYPLRPTTSLRDRDIRAMSPRYDLVVQTFPSEEGTRRRPNRATSFPIWWKEIPESPFLMLWYNGGEGAWVRQTMGCGIWSIEFPTSYELDMEIAASGWTIAQGRDLKHFTRPYTTGLASNVLLVGRYARWDRKFLAHHTYQLVLDAIDELEAA